LLGQHRPGVCLVVVLFSGRLRRDPRWTSNYGRQGRACCRSHRSRTDHTIERKGLFCSIIRKYSSIFRPAASHETSWWWCPKMENAPAVGSGGRCLVGGVVNKFGLSRSTCYCVVVVVVVRQPGLPSERDRMLSSDFWPYSSRPATFQEFRP